MASISQPAETNKSVEMWWWCTAEEPVDDTKDEENVRAYWDDLTVSAAPVVSKRENLDDEFATEELDDQELAALGRVLLRHQGVEARTRATRDFFASRVKPPQQRREDPKVAPKVGSAAWRARLEHVRAQLSSDKKSLAQRQAKRASFLTEKPSMRDAQLRQERSTRRLDELTKGGPRRTTKSRVSFREDDDDLEVKAAVDLHWKQVS